MTDPEETSADIAELAGRLFTMARDGDAESLKAYLDAGVPVDLNNEAGDTLVMLAAYHGHPRTVRMLVGKGADVNRPNEKGQTPLAGAVFKGEDEVVGELVEAGADPHGGHPSAIDAARMFGREDYLGLLGK
ncbi:ankyrin repeat domain-containing protein [Rhodococcus sp. BP22]|uniref:ankyrin repeat domain-containing protein n=1 Tax=Rhodococcus sp. BP22 TaxID=2758566 RepID=UPI0016484DD5|nr:ankyrin repeat domain-containing protein [Rhodococcus sp. BP22]